MSKNNINSKLIDLVREVEEVIGLLDKAAASPTPISTWDYKSLIKSASRSLAASKNKLLDDDNLAIMCKGCYLVHHKNHRINGKENSFGLTPTVCPNCGNEGYEVIPF